MYVPVPRRLNPQRSGSVHVSMHPDGNRSAPCFVSKRGLKVRKGKDRYQIVYVNRFLV